MTNQQHDPATILRRTLEQVIAKWRDEAERGQNYQLGDAQWSAALSARVYATCAAELDKALAGIAVSPHPFQPSDSDDVICGACGGWPNEVDHQPLPVASLAPLPVVPREEPETPDVQLLAWAVSNCHTLARRALARTTSAYDREKWEHVLRICEKAGARSRGVLRAAVPTEITEGAASGDTPPPDRREEWRELRERFVKYRDAPIPKGNKVEIATIRKTLNVVVAEMDKLLAAPRPSPAPPEPTTLSGKCGCDGPTRIDPNCKWHGNKRTNFTDRDYDSSCGGGY